MKTSHAVDMETATCVQGGMMIELTTCYQCEAELVAPKGAVHPLCRSCEAGFDDWFSQQLIQLQASPTQTTND